MQRIGITTTVPIEIILAGGCIPVDLNNLFIAQDSLSLVYQAEMEGFPRNFCAWIKGIYSVVRQEGITRIMAVTQGDCSNTQALMETLVMHGVAIIPFAYPYDRDEELLRLQMERLLKIFNSSWSQVMRVKEQLDRIRQKVQEIDRLTWQENLVTGFENHFFQISCSDMQGDALSFEARLDQFLNDLSLRKSEQGKLRLGFIGVPPIFSDFYSFLEAQGARLVFNEVQRQFSMPGCGQGEDLVRQYLSYTYPYDIFGRIDDIKKQIQLRRLDGLIHYTQSFCFHRLEDLIIRKMIHLPILTLEGDNPGKIDERTKIRLESFLLMLQDKKGRGHALGC